MAPAGTSSSSAHTPRKSGNTIDLYTTFPWETLCAEVAKLKVQRQERGQLARLPLAASAEKESPSSPDGGRGLATSSGGGGNQTCGLRQRTATVRPRQSAELHRW